MRGDRLVWQGRAARDRDGVARRGRAARDVGGLAHLSRSAAPNPGGASLRVTAAGFGGEPRDLGVVQRNVALVEARIVRDLLADSV